MAHARAWGVQGYGLGARFTSDPQSAALEAVYIHHVVHRTMHRAVHAEVANKRWPRPAASLRAGGSLGAPRALPVFVDGSRPHPPYLYRRGGRGSPRPRRGLAPGRAPVRPLPTARGRQRSRPCLAPALRPSSPAVASPRPSWLRARPSWARPRWPIALLAAARPRSTRTRRKDRCWGHEC